MISGHFGKANGIQFYGGNKKILVFCSEKTSLADRQNFYRIASGIANAIVQGASKNNPSVASESNKHRDDMSQFITAQQDKFNNAPVSVPTPVQVPNQYNQPVQEEQNNRTDLYNSPTNFSESKSRNEPSDQLMILSAMMVVDRNIHRNELKIIVDYGVKLGMERAAIEEIVNTSKNQPDNILRSIKLAKIYKDEELMHMVVRVAFSDGKIANEELEMLRLIAKKMNYSNEELKVILEEEKRNYRP